MKRLTDGRCVVVCVCVCVCVQCVCIGLLVTAEAATSSSLLSSAVRMHERGCVQYTTLCLRRIHGLLELPHALTHTQWRPCTLEQTNSLEEGGAW